LPRHPIVCRTRKTTARGEVYPKVAGQAKKPSRGADPIAPPTFPKKECLRDHVEASDD
jgi:hypothetical protein